MIVEYKSKKLEKVCTNDALARKKYGIDMANKITQCINNLIVFDSVEELIKYHIGRCHPLLNNRKGQYAMDLIHPYRMIFKVKAEKVQIAKIIEIVDYH